MSISSKIEWTDASWTPIRARNLKTGKLGWHCEHATSGCINCYAEGMNKRLGTGLPFKPGHRKDIEIFLDEKMLLAPLHWKRPRMIFVCSMTDLFADFVKDEWIDKIFAVMALCPQHTFQVLTKRAERMKEYCSAENKVERVKAAIEKHGNSLGPDAEDFEFFGKIGWDARLEPCKPDCVPPCRLIWKADGGGTIRAKDHDGAATHAGECGGKVRWDGKIDWPLPNVWLGVSCERQEEADERIPLLLQAPAAVRFISAEPLLGPINLTCLLGPHVNGGAVDSLNGVYWNATDKAHGKPSGICNRLDQVIVGGESGSRARPTHPQWPRDLRDQCVGPGVAFFFKQWGEWLPVGQHLPGAGKIHGATAIKPGRMKLHYAGSPDREPKYAFAETGVQVAAGDNLDLLFRVGKQAAGRLLDGIEHNGFPQVRS
jgi:protein gp37